MKTLLAFFCVINFSLCILQNAAALQLFEDFDIHENLRYWNKTFPGTQVPKALQKHLAPYILKSRRSSPSVAQNSFQKKVQENLHANIFFLFKEFHVGTNVTVQLINTVPRTVFLPRSLVEDIPITSDRIEEAFERLNISSHSKLGRMMRSTVLSCEARPITGERKGCFSSLESILDFVTAEIGTGPKTFLETDISQDDFPLVKSYTIIDIPYQSKFNASYIACHTKEYPYGFYFCHHSPASKAAQVTLRSHYDNKIVTAAAICHSDTHEWFPQHMAFISLNVKPGGPAICHFIPDDHLVFMGLDS